MQTTIDVAKLVNSTSSKLQLRNFRRVTGDLFKIYCTNLYCSLILQRVT